MQNGRGNLWSTLEVYLDMFIQLTAILGAYLFAILLLQVEEYPPILLNSPQNVLPILVLVILFSLVFQAFGSYHPTQNRRFARALGTILRSESVCYGVTAVLALLLFRDDQRLFLLWWTLSAYLFSLLLLIFKKQVIIDILHALHKRRYVLRKVIIIGDNTAAAAEYVREITANPELGFMILGCVGAKISPAVGCEKLGSFPDLERILDEYKPTDVVFAIDAYDKRHLIRLVNLCEDRCIRVYFLPVIYGFFKSSRQLEQIGGLPLVNIHTTPLDNFANAMLKRIVDVVGSVVLIILTSPIMLFAAIGVRVSSPGPILFRQKRVGKMGKSFTMLKFRSMRVNDASDTTWTTADDARKTRFGNFIRRTSIDELPQLFNVLSGSMSLVGPRPEIPVFVEYFKKEIPLYMVKHYVKPGMTGLAQVRGLRGDTSVEERIHADIAYIENWSLGLDIGILLRTPFKAVNKQERYVEEPARNADAPDADVNATKPEANEAPAEETANEVTAPTRAVEANATEATETAASAPEAESTAESDAKAQENAEESDTGSGIGGENA